MTRERPKDTLAATRVSLTFVVLGAAPEPCALGAAILALTLPAALAALLGAAPAALGTALLAAPLTATPLSAARLATALHVLTFPLHLGLPSFRALPIPETTPRKTAPPPGASA